MSVLVFAQPQAAGGPIMDAGSNNIVHTWTGWDGSVWRFTRKQGVWLAPDGIRGMDDPAVTHYRRQSASLNGAQWRGYIVPERDVFWPLRVGAVKSPPVGEEWRGSFLELDRAFRKTLRPGKTGVWTVSLPGGQARSLTCRNAPDGNHTTTGSPFVIGTAWYGISLVADDPFWHGQPITRSWSQPEGVFFYGGEPESTPTPTEAAPAFGISSSSTYGSAEVTNPGDVEAWPVWTIFGPCDSAQVGVGTQTVEVPFAIADGDSLTIDTNPTKQTAVLSDGTSKTADLGSVTWGMVPPDDPTTLNINTVGGGSVSVTITPLHLRAW